MFPPELLRLNMKQGHPFPGPGRDAEHTDGGTETLSLQLCLLLVASEGASATLSLGRASDPNPHSSAPLGCNRLS